MTDFGITKSKRTALVVAMLCSITMPRPAEAQDASARAYASLRQDLPGSKYQFRRSTNDAYGTTLGDVGGITMNDSCDVRLEFSSRARNSTWNDSIFRTVLGAYADGSRVRLERSGGVDTFLVLDSATKAQRVARAMSTLIGGCLGTEQSAVDTLTLDFEPGDGSGFLHARRGYRSASIKLHYRFLACADEIQIAYSLDRKSLEHSDTYVDGFNGFNPHYMTPTTEPAAPASVALALKINLKSPGQAYVTTIRDQYAGEALGMGCFTGQTARVGFISALVGPNATRAKINAYLSLLTAGPVSVGASVGYPLYNASVPVPPTPPRAKTGAKPKPK